MELIDRYRTAKALYIRLVYNNGLFTCKDRDYLPVHTISEKGFRGRDGLWDKKIESPNYNWYRNFQDNGPKSRIFREALNSIENTGARVILVVSPLSSSWKHDTTGSRTLDIEKKFIAFAALAMKNPGSSVISFFNAPDTTFSDSLFIDPLHLNAKGAEKLTTMIADSINKIIAIGNNNR
ncbi:MAG TPA: hypothetical protein DCO75_00830 [Fibrobacteres bacterium]|nr:hypothetical protein [Fibrobacterota bacterium]